MSATPVTSFGSLIRDGELSRVASLEAGADSLEEVDVEAEVGTAVLLIILNPP